MRRYDIFEATAIKAHLTIPDEGPPTWDFPVVRNNRIAASQATQLVDDQLGVQGKALLDNHVPSSDNSQE